MMNAEPAGSQLSLCQLGPAPALPCPGWIRSPKPRKTGVRSRRGAGAALRSQLNAPETRGPSQMTLKTVEDAHRPPWQPLPMGPSRGDLGRWPRTAASYLLGQLAPGSCQGTSLLVRTY